MRRGDVVTVAAAGDFGKPRPAVVIQTDALPAAHASVIICPFTSTLSGELDFRVHVQPGETNGLRIASDLMVDKPTTVRRDRVGQVVGRLDPADIRRLNAALAFVLGLTD